jgi:hypothetical protein
MMVMGNKILGVVRLWTSMSFLLMMMGTECLAHPFAHALSIFSRLVELFYARQEQANISVASVQELCAMVKLGAVSTLSSALTMGARPDQLDESGVNALCASRLQRQLS